MLTDPDSDQFVTIYNDFPDYPQEFGDRVRHVHCTPEGIMLVATVGGLIWFEPSDNTQRTVFHFVHKIPGDIHSLGNNDVIQMFTDRKGRTWLSTFGGGLNRMEFADGNPRFNIISEKDGLGSNIVFSAVDDDKGEIWMATERGLSKYDPESGAVTNYSRYDGVSPAAFSEAACARLSDGRLLFGTSNNVCSIEPSRFSYTSADPMLAITGFSLGDVRVPIEDEVTVPYDCSFFRVDFASLNFTIQGKIKYTYKLEGYDKDWISAAGSHSVVYSRIPPGKYVFKVSAAASESLSESQTVSLAIKVKPSFWASWPMVTLYVILALLLIDFLLRLLLTSVKLRNDVKLEQDLNQMKMRFFTNISHELRTPLTLILGGIDEVSKHIPSGHNAEYGVNLVYKNAKRMLTLVNQLLDIRRIVNGKLHLKVRQLDIVALLKDVYDDFRDMAAERQMEMRITHSVDSLMVWGDAMRLEALIYNLLSNAFKFTSDGGMIEAAVYWREGDTEYTIMVKDNGIGVSKDKQKSIFEPFIQATDAVFKGMGSSGIGLSFCKEIAEIHGGRIWVESEKNEGASFFVRLPLGRDHFTPEVAEFLNEDTKSVPSFGLSKYKVEPTYPEGAAKILVVEDNAELKVYIYNNLVNQYEVRDASNGREALEVIASGWMPDMIVTDLMMPELDGIGLINSIRNDFNTSHIPIIVITARHEDDTHLKAMKYGADGYIAKPFTMELLLVKIENLFQRRKQLAAMIGNVNPQGTASSGRNAAKVSLSPEEIVITDRDEELLRKVSKWLEDNISDSEVTVEQLAVHVGMGRTSMYNKIKGLTGKSPVELIQEYRLEKATFYLKSGQYSVSETSYKVGFSDPGYFSRSFKKHFGMSPADYMKQNRQ
ncbi:MAG: ATP-binding protein [Candidatus Cryptobacteroides sp.]